MPKNGPTQELVHFAIQWIDFPIPYAVLGRNRGLGSRLLIRHSRDVRSSIGDGNRKSGFTAEE